LSITLPLRNQAQLADFLQRLYNPSDPEYRHYLTGAQFDSQYGPTQADYNNVVRWAQSQGLTITKQYSSRTILNVAGSTAVVQRAFGVKIANLTMPDGTIVHSHLASPAIPQSIASVISSVIGLSNANLRRYSHISPKQNLRAEFQNPLGLAPKLGTGPAGGLAPADVKTAYNLTGIVTTSTGTSTMQGEGQSVALFELDSYVQSDITTYANQFNLGVPNLTNVLVDGYSPKPLDGQTEVVLDIDMILALAPKTHIYVYQAANLTPSVLDMYQQIADDFNTTHASVVSTSWGLDEASAGSTTITAEATAFAKMAAQGQTIYAAAGDQGAYDNGTTLSVDDPASQPGVTAVGGTQLTVRTAGGAYLAETSWNSFALGTLLGPEGGGGGISSVWPLQTWESGTFWSGLKITNRTVPDVALDADPQTGYDIFVAATVNGVPGGWQTEGGTSAAAPLWGGMTALVNQLRAADGLTTSLGFANPAFYSIGNTYSATSTTTTYASTFHDITTGTNLFYSAGPAYDMSTGWGSFFGDAMVSELAGKGIEALPKGPLTGTVTDTNSAPIKGAIITALTTGNSQVAGTATTDASGAYTIQLPVGIPLNVSADGDPTSAIKYAGMTVNNVVVKTSGTTPVNFTLLGVSPFAQNSINFITVPYDFTGVADFATLFGLTTPLTASDPKLYYWDPIHVDYVQTPVSPADTFHIGYGYWVKFGSSANGWYLHRQGIPASLTQPFNLALQPGWNMIGDPYLNDYPLNKVQIDSAIAPGNPTTLAASTLTSPVLYIYTGGAGNYTTLNDTTGVLPAGKGVWLYCFSSSGATMILQPSNLP